MKKKQKIFRGQKDDETVVAIFHKHWISFVKPLAVFVPLFALSLIILYYQSFLGTGFLIMGYVIFLVAISYLMYYFVLWWWDVYILTNKRVINFDQRTLFHKVVSEAELTNIQDTTYEIKGVWQTIFNYGQVNILTASSGDNIIFTDVAAPQLVQEIIIETKGKKL